MPDINASDFNTEIIRMSGILRSNQLALARILSELRKTPFETERDKLIKESNDFAKALFDDLREAHRREQR